MSETNGNSSERLDRLEASHVRLMTEHELFVKEHEKRVAEQDIEWEREKDRWRQRDLEFERERKERKEADAELARRVAELVSGMGAFIARLDKPEA